MRLPSEGGRAQLYQPDSLTELNWQIPSGVPSMARALGTDLDDRMVYGVNSKGEVIGIDLISRKPRPYLSRASKVSGSADGVILAVDSAGRLLRFASRGLTTYRGTIAEDDGTVLVRGRGDLLAAYSPERGEIQVFDEDGELRRIKVPRGKLASSWFGDLLMVTSQAGISLVDPRSDGPPNTIELAGLPLTGIFSPSAHRLYVARARGDILLLDRFNPSRELGRIAVPGPVQELRADRSGRWLLARPETGDSVWLIDLVRQELMTTLTSPWAEDLPMVTNGRTVLVREGTDVVGYSLIGERPLEFSRLAGGAQDIYLSVPWAPSGPLPSSRSLAAVERPPDLDAPIVIPSVDNQADAMDSVAQQQVGPPVEIYIQVTSSQNEPWARNLADQLRGIGFRSRVLEPIQPGDGFKVVVGPYTSREEADADGKRLGRPYFVTTEGSEDT